MAGMPEAACVLGQKLAVMSVSRGAFIPGAHAGPAGRRSVSMHRSDREKEGKADQHHEKTLKRSWRSAVPLSAPTLHRRAIP